MKDFEVYIYIIVETHIVYEKPLYILYGETTDYRSMMHTEKETSRQCRGTQRKIYVSYYRNSHDIIASDI